MAVEDEVFDNRPINLRLSVCSTHNHKRSLKRLRTKALRGRRRVEISGLHPEFVERFQEMQNEKWSFVSDENTE